MQTKKKALELVNAITRGLRHTRPDLRADHVVLRNLVETRYHQWRADCVVMFKLQQVYIRQDCVQSMDNFFRACGCEATDAEAIEKVYATLPKL